MIRIATLEEHGLKIGLTKSFPIIWSQCVWTLIYIFRYPGCACDIPSANYQFTWARNPNWSQFYSDATEIWQYLKDVVNSFDLTKYMKFRHLVTGAYWVEQAGLWEVHIEDLHNGTTFIDRAEVLLNGSGLLK